MNRKSSKKSKTQRLRKSSKKSKTLLRKSSKKSKTQKLRKYKVVSSSKSKNTSKSKGIKKPKLTIKIPSELLKEYRDATKIKLVENGKRTKIGDVIFNLRVQQEAGWNAPGIPLTFRPGSLLHITTEENAEHINKTLTLKPPKFHNKSYLGGNQPNLIWFIEGRCSHLFHIFSTFATPGIVNFMELLDDHRYYTNAEEINVLKQPDGIEICSSLDEIKVKDITDKVIDSCEKYFFNKLIKLKKEHRSNNP